MFNGPSLTRSLNGIIADKHEVEIVGDDINAKIVEGSRHSCLPLQPHQFAELNYRPEVQVLDFCGTFKK